MAIKAEDYIPVIRIAGGYNSDYPINVPKVTVSDYPIGPDDVTPKKYVDSILGSANFYNVRDFGATGDGTTFDHVAIQAAVDAADTEGGGVVYLPKGTYKTGETITWPSNVSLHGDGPGKSIIKMVGVSFNAISQFGAGPSGGGDPDVVPLTDIVFRDFEIDGSGLTSTAPSVSGKGFYIYYMKRAKFLNLYVHHCIGTGIGADYLDETVMDGVVANYNGRNWDGVNTTIGQSGIGIGTNWKTVESVTVTNCHASFNGNYGFFVETQAETASQTVWPEGARMVGCYAEGNRIGFGNKGSGGTTFDGCEARNSLKWGFLSNQKSKDDIFVGCRSTGSGEHGFFFKDMQGNVTMTGCVSANNTWNGIRFEHVASYSMNNLSITDCVVRDNGRQGMVLSGGASGIVNYILTGCMVKDNGKNLESSSRQGIVTSGLVNDGMITGNWIGNSSASTSQEYALQLLGTTTDLDIRGNTFARNTVAAQVGLGGTRTNVTIGRDNTGYKNYAVGTGTIANGNTTVTVTHGLVSTPTKCLVSPVGDVNVWASTLGSSGIIFSRTGTTGAVDFTYLAEV